MQMTMAGKAIPRTRSIRSTQNLLAVLLALGLVSFGSTPLKWMGVPHIPLIVLTCFLFFHAAGSGWIRSESATVLLVSAAIAVATCISAIGSSDVGITLAQGSYIAVGLAAGAIILGFPGSGSRSWGAVEIALLVIVMVTSAQLALQLFTDGLTHESRVQWGGSNYVTACTVGATLHLWSAKQRLCVRNRNILVVVLISSIALSLLILSRGTFVALAVSVLFGTLRTLRHSKLSAVLSGLALAAIAYFGYQWITAERLDQAHAELLSRNIDARFWLWAQAFDDFLLSPLTGTGPAALLKTSAENIGGKGQVHAHNVLASFLQQFGAFSIPFLLALGTACFLALKKLRGVSVVPAAFILVISMIEPFFEGVMGAFVGTVVVGSAFKAARPQWGSRSRPDVHDGAITVGRTRGVSQWT